MVELDLLIKPGNIGDYSHCKVEQVVLFKGKDFINYYTNIDFSSKYNSKSEFEYLTSCPPKTITNEYKLAISKYTIDIDEFKKIYCDAASTGKWKFNGASVELDNTYISPGKFIPESDPTGGRYNEFVPLELFLNGTNFRGGYYIHELFSRKSKLESILEKDIIDKIQSEMKKYGLNGKYRLDKLKDRIGNVVCRFNVEVLNVDVISIGVKGIELDFSVPPTKKCSLHIFQEHDGMIYRNELVRVFGTQKVKVDYRQCKTTISIIDDITGLTLYFGRFDYSHQSSNYSQISPHTNQFISQDVNYELDTASKRKVELDHEWLCDNGYLKMYKGKEHGVALEDIVSIINNKDLLWDLEEILIFDPYLSANDLISTVLKCKKSGVRIKALCHYSKVKGLIRDGGFDSFKETQKKMLENEHVTDIKLEFRTVHDNHGMEFHDRYIILRYQTNQARIWSIGSSFNSIGNSQSIIHIVEGADLLLPILDALWHQTKFECCLIYSNINR